MEIDANYKKSIAIKTFAIETSCDDTSCAIVELTKNNYIDVVKLVSISQIDKHQKYWWVVPELASRLHEQEVIKILDDFGVDEIKKTNYICYTAEPGLPGSLLIGKSMASSLSVFLDKNKIPVNHIFGHICAIFLERNLSDIKFPFVVLTASGGHNDIYILEKNGKQIIIKKIGQTLDDAAWEAFDKVSRMLGGPYPWWSWIGKKAAKWKKQDDINLPRIFMKKDNWDFSFSGLKAQSSYTIEKLKEKYNWFDDQLLNNFCFDFQEAIIEVLARKLLKAAKFHNISNIAICWWVSANIRLSEYINSIKDKFQIENFYKPTKSIYSTDNAAMIWSASLIMKKYDIIWLSD